MKIVYGNPKTTLAVGVAGLGDKPTPFFAFVDSDKIRDKPLFSEGDADSAAMIAGIEAAGGTIVYIENPDAAHRFTQQMLSAFVSAANTMWFDITETEVGLQ